MERDLGKMSADPFDQAVITFCDENHFTAFEIVNLREPIKDKRQNSVSLIGPFHI